MHLAAAPGIAGPSHLELQPCTRSMHNQVPARPHRWLVNRAPLGRSPLARHARPARTSTPAKGPGPALEDCRLACALDWLSSGSALQACPARPHWPAPQRAAGSRRTAPVFWSRPHVASSSGALLAACGLQHPPSSRKGAAGLGRIQVGGGSWPSAAGTRAAAAAASLGRGAARAAAIIAHTCPPRTPLGRREGGQACPGPADAVHRQVCSLPTCCGPLPASIVARTTQPACRGSQQAPGQAQGSLLGGPQHARSEPLACERPPARPLLQRPQLTAHTRMRHVYTAGEARGGGGVWRGRRV